MKKLKELTSAKITAFILLVIFAFTALLSGLGGIYCISNLHFSKTQSEIEEVFYNDLAYEYSTVIYNGIYFDEKGDVNINSFTDDISSAVDFSVYNSKSNELLFESKTGDEKTTYLTEFEDHYYAYHIIKTDGVTEYVDENIKIVVMLKTFEDNGVFSARFNIAKFLYENRFYVLVIFAVSFIASVITYVFLLCSAGYKKGFSGVKTTAMEKIPFDIFTAISGGIILFSGLFSIELAGSYFDFYSSIYSSAEIMFLILVAIFFLLLLAGFVFVVWSMSFAKRVKTKNAVRSSVIYRLLKFIFGKFKKLFSVVCTLFKNISLIWKSLIIIIALSFVELLFLINGELDNCIIFWLLEKLVLIPIVLITALILRRIEDGGKKLASGDMNSKIDTTYMFWDFKKHAENLNSVGDGLALAVEEQMKSERFKTELITNVSHDIKTPLTSIINYVDLLKKEDPEGEKVKEYLEVLDRQSVRLKKLIEDLVEASKASSGSLAVNLAPCEIGIVLTQAVGEYQEKLRSLGLELIVKQTDRPIKILADGRHLWRVFDNLLNNICKHALPGSRVYLTLEQINNEAVISFKNVSKYELDIKAEELMERFVRGDKSRNTEGSGLGLSIAKSLTELQKGKFELVTDGDLFKAVLIFSVI